MTRLVAAALAMLAPLVAASGACSQPTRHERLLVSIAVDNGGARFVGDAVRFTTISPNGDGTRDAAYVRFSLARAATVRVEIAQAKPDPRVVHTDTVRGVAGDNVYAWRPDPAIEPRTYLVRLTIAGSRYGAYRFLEAARPDNVVVRVQGVDAAFGHASYRPGELAQLAVATDARALEVQLFRAGGVVTTHRSDVMEGFSVSGVTRFDWRAHRSRPHAIAIRIGHWRSGVYFARVTASDGRVGYAPFVLRPRRLGEHRIAVVMPTNTWQAYNFYDRDGDGFGDTWYAAWKQTQTRLGRPFLKRGVPPHFGRYDAPFVRWLDRERIRADFLADVDVERAAASALARAYDLVVYPGHSEYVTAREYGTIRAYRDRGGNLAFLSANNFFWKVVRHGPVMERVAQWRTLGKPEAALIGAQYRGNDEGERRAPFVVADVDAAPWLFEGTGLANGSTFGSYGIEIDGTAPSSPPGTKVLAVIPNLYGPRYSAEMTYYETQRGAKVFAAGAFTLAGDAGRPVVSRLLANLFARLGKP